MEIGRTTRQNSISVLWTGFEIGTQKDTAISLCQVVYPLNPLHENEALETARRNIKIANIVQEEDDKFLHQHDVINDLAAEGHIRISKAVVSWNH